MRNGLGCSLLEKYGGNCRAENVNETDNTTAERLSETSPLLVPKANQPEVFFGRRVLTYSVRKSELTGEKIREILPQVLREHDRNAREISYLYNIYKGKQPILNKTKEIRPEINNIVLENHAFEIVEFKKAYVYGRPIQYVQKGEKNTEKVNPEISKLNRFMESEDKASLDKEVAEWNYICGTAYRWTDIDKDEQDEDEDVAPFEIRVPDPRRTFVVYSSGIKEEQLFSGHISYFSENIQTEDGREFISKFRIITVYTEEFMYEFKQTLNNSFGYIEQLTFDMPINDTRTEKVKAYPLIVKGHRIIEYPLNKARLGLIELILTELNAINRIKSDDLDAIDQFVQSLLVFVNQEIDLQTFKQLVAAGAIQVSSSDPNKPADVKLLTSQLVHSETKVVTDDLYNNMLTICGIPRLNDKASGGDTGQARLLGEGWTMADERANQDELSFKRSERQFLKLILRICKYKNQLNSLKISDIDINFTRNKSDNLLVKTQGLMNMKEAQVSPDVAFSICELFSDPNDVYAKSKKFFGENFWKEEVQESSNDDFNSELNSEQNQGTSNKQEQDQKAKQNNPASGDNN